MIIRATNSGGLFKDQKFTISVTNVNEAPTDITLTNAGVIENAAAATHVATSQRPIRMPAARSPMRS